MRFDFKEFIPVLIGLILGVTSIIVGYLDTTLDRVSIRQGISIAFSIFCILGGLVVSLHFQRSSAVHRIMQLFQEVTQSLPQGLVLTTHTSHQALELLTVRLQKATNALNTRVSYKAEPNEPRQVLLNDWEMAISDAVRAGLNLVEVFSPNWRELAEARRNKFAGKNSYEAYVLKFEPHAFLNFIVLTYPPNHKEVWFGWLMSPGYGFTFPCIRCCEPKVVQLFEAFHRELVASVQER